MAEVEQHHQAFGGHTGISAECWEDIDYIKNNRFYEELIVQPEDASLFTNLAWKLLGRYIANNTILSALCLDGCSLNDQNISALFTNLTRSKSIQTLDLENNEFGIEGLRCIVPFLVNSPHLSTLYLKNNNYFNLECFELLVDTLHRASSKRKKLICRNCNITDISALDTYALQNLQHFNLSNNNIGREGCRILSGLLQKEDTSLKYLYLDNTGMGDEEAEILATPLKHNTKLKILSMTNNNITKSGCLAFLKLLVDGSSIENTYNSNHTLSDLSLEIYGTRKVETDRHINSAVRINKYSPNSHAAGRAKVIKYQLNNQNRKEQYHLQGVEYTSIGNLFADIEPLLLPNILALIGVKHGQSELYTSLIPMVPDLMSHIDRRALIDDAIAEKSRDIAAVEATLAELTKERDALQSRRACMDSKADTQGKDEGDEQKVTSCGGKKRRMEGV